jgi:hypothetical protein
MHGYLVQCRQCNNIQLAFGNICVTFSVSAFDEFFALVKNIAANAPHTFLPGTKCIYIPLPCEEIKLLLSPEEANILLGMLDASDTELRSQNLLSLFNN